MEPKRGVNLGAIFILAIVAVLLILFFFFPEVWWRITQYQGPGSPFVQPP